MYRPCQCSGQLLAGCISKDLGCLRRSNVLSLYKGGKSPEIFIFGGFMMTKLYSFSSRNGAMDMKSLRSIPEYSQDNVFCCQPVTFSVVPGCEGRTEQLNLGSELCKILQKEELWSESYFSGVEEHLQKPLTPMKTQTETIFDV